ncbi:MAG: hypothetical protein NT000_07145 [Proteobacteria bacterium]|nr:hypothetical protein [Pseudomonadota bacterium]
MKTIQKWKEDPNKLTNTRDPEIAADLPVEWKGVDTSSLVAIRFGQHQLVQIHRLGMLTVEQVQESISSFAFDLEVNGKSKEINGHALNYFTGYFEKGLMPHQLIMRPQKFGK